MVQCDLHQHLEHPCSGLLQSQALGGQYRLCWCSSGQHCSSGEQFRTDFGSFTLVGPSGSNQDRTCIAGLSCVVEAIAGQDLSVLNQYAVLDTCGVASPIAGMPALETTAYNAAVTSVTVTAVAGQYRLCWCSGLLNQAPVGSNSTDNQSNGSRLPVFPPMVERKPCQYELALQRHCCPVSNR